MNFIDTLKGLYNTVIDGVKMRVVNPLASGFLFAWIVFNWKGLYYFFIETGSAESKINHIEMFYSDITYNLFYPALTALCYIFLFPLLTQASTSVWTIMDKWGSSLANRVIPELSPISRAEKAALIDMVNNKNSELVKQLNEKDFQIEALNSLVKPEVPVAPAQPDINDNSLSQALDEMEGNEINRKIAAANKREAELIVKDELETLVRNNEPSTDPILKKASSRWSGNYYRFFKSVKGKHLLREFLSQQLKLSRDNKILNTEVEIASAVFEKIMFSEEHAIIPATVRSKVEGTDTTFDVNRVYAMVEKLVNFDLLRNKGEMYTLSNKGNMLLMEVYEAEESVIEVTRAVDSV